MGVWGLIGVISGALVSIWAAFKFVIGQSFRLDDNLSKNILPVVQKLKYKFELNNEISINKKYPSTYSAFALLSGIPIYYTRTERLLTAGWQSKELISEVYYFRWHRKKVEKLIKEIANNKKYTNVMALMPWGSDKLGQMTRESNPKVYIDDNQYKDIEKDIEDMLERNGGKTSALLYGKPGTGKTRLIKYLSLKYDLPIYSIFLNPEYNNFDILSMFADVPERCIVLF